MLHLHSSLSAPVCWFISAWVIFGLVLSIQFSAHQLLKEDLGREAEQLPKKFFLRAEGFRQEFASSYRQNVDVQLGMCSRITAGEVVLCCFADAMSHLRNHSSAKPS